MKYLFAFLLAALFVFGGAYLVIAFTKWEFNSFGEWQEHQRAFYIFFCILLTCFVTPAFMAIASEIGSKK